MISNGKNKILNVTKAIQKSITRLKKHLYIISYLTKDFNKANVKQFSERAYVHYLEK